MPIDPDDMNNLHDLDFAWREARVRATEAKAAWRRAKAEETEAEAVRDRAFLEADERIRDENMQALSPTGRGGEEVGLPAHQPANTSGQRKGRQGHKLTWEDAERIRALSKAGTMHVDIARQFNIAPSMVSEIMKGTHWTIPPAPQIPEGFVPWSGGEQPVPNGVGIELLFPSGIRFSRWSEDIDWSRSFAYCVESRSEAEGKADASCASQVSNESSQSLQRSTGTVQRMIEKLGGAPVERDKHETTLQTEFVLQGEEGSPDPDEEGWYRIPHDTTHIVIKQDTEFKCDDGNIRQRRVPQGDLFLEVELAAQISRFTHWRNWKPALDWAPYYGLMPPSHAGYHLETSVRAEDGQNMYRYVPTDEFIPHEPDTIPVSSLSRGELDEMLAASGLVLGEPKS